jgi:hypothetical protein
MVVLWTRIIIILFFAGLFATAHSMVRSSPVAGGEVYSGDSATVFSLYGQAGWRTYPSYFNGYWQPYPFAGITLDLPTGASRIFLRTSIDAAHLNARAPSSTKLLAMHGSVCGMAEIGHRTPFVFRAGIGVSSATFFFSSTLDVDENLFTTSESEFGLVSSLEAVYRYKKIEITVPFSFDYIMSLPHPLLMVSIGLQAGATF